VGTLQQLRAAFATADWIEADPLGFASSANGPHSYSLALSGRPIQHSLSLRTSQDIGFQKAIDNSPGASAITYVSGL
jgi:hypothetical protein